MSSESESFLNAIRAGDVAQVLQIINTNPDIVMTTPLALHVAAEEGHLEVVQALIAANPNLINAVAPNGDTALHLAAKFGHLKVAEALIVSNPDFVNVAGQVGWTALHVAAQNGQLEVLGLLIEKGVNVNVVAPNGATALYLAIKYGHLEVVKFLIAANPDLVNVAGQGGLTALHVAAQHGQLGVLGLLIEKGANINAVVQTGYTALHLAAKFDHLEVVKFLIAANPDLVNVAGQGGLTALHVAVGLGHLGVVQFLIKIYPDLANVAGQGGFTALHLAVGLGHLGVVQFLIEAHPDLLNVAAQGGSKPLHHANNRGRFETIFDIYLSQCTELDLHNIPLTEISFGKLLDIIRSTKNLTHLNLQNINFTPEQIELLRVAMEGNHTITTFLSSIGDAPDFRSYCDRNKDEIRKKFNIAEGSLKPEKLEALYKMHPQLSEVIDSGIIDLLTMKESIFKQPPSAWQAIIDSTKPIKAAAITEVISTYIQRLDFVDAMSLIGSYKSLKLNYKTFLEALVLAPAPEDDVQVYEEFVRLIVSNVDDLDKNPVYYNTPYCSC
ncbi:MAG UNVERIFIED_CONTAM: ankyrin repeat domain-containing protein [Rickettsiaceae bacterium]|jgi:ankyrin repeat protein